MRLFDLIFDATENQNVDAVWKITIKFEPLINNSSKNIVTKQIDEDLKSEIYMKLLSRIKTFHIRCI